MTERTIESMGLEEDDVSIDQQEKGKEKTIEDLGV
jgi:hypothetical protein